MGNKNIAQIWLVPMLIIIALSLSGCTNTPDEMKDAIYTEAAQTIVAELTTTAASLPATETATAIPSETPSPMPSPTAVAIILPPTQPIAEQPTEVSSSAYPYKVEFVSSSPFPNQFLPGQKFTLTWQFKNTGTANLSWKTKFYHSNGIQLADQSSYSIDTPIDPGGILTISMPATAPSQLGTHQSEWVFQDPNGIIFFTVYYVAIVGEQTFVTDLPGQPSPTPNSLYWMCSDLDRSNIQGNGCYDYCRLNGRSMWSNGINCYSNGSLVTDFY
jgi:hypothetical protein